MLGAAQSVPRHQVWAGYATDPMFYTRLALLKAIPFFSHGNTDLAT